MLPLSLSMIAILSRPPMKMLMPACHSAVHARPQLAFAFRMAVAAASVAGALEAAALLTGAMALSLTHGSQCGQSGHLGVFSACSSR